MIVSALVLTLDVDAARRDAALASLAADARLTLGAPIAARLPVVAETASIGDGEALVRELADVDGVVKVDVVSIDFEEVS